MRLSGVCLAGSIEWLLCIDAMMPILWGAGLVVQLGFPRRGAITVGRREEILVGRVVVEIVTLDRWLLTWHVIRGHHVDVVRVGDFIIVSSNAGL